MTIFFGGIVNITVDEVWPDGDAPTNPTAADVVAVLERGSGKWHTLNEWNLTDDIEVSVATAGEYRQAWA